MALQGEFSHLTVLEPFLESYERELFRDDQHLNGAGFEQFSRQLAERTARYLAGKI